MSKLTTHFDTAEFACKCGCGKYIAKSSLMERLEKLHDKLQCKCIIVNSGYRCPTHSVAVGGYSNDAHTLGFAADVVCYKQDGTPYSVETVAYYADQLGFGGIGMMGGNAIHLDTRDVEQYANNYWRGDERTGKNFDPKNLKPETIQQRKTDTTSTYTVKINNKAVWSGTEYPATLTITKE